MLLSLSWVPFAIAARPLRSGPCVEVAAKVGALLAALLGQGPGPL